jgi:hypothetical protein
MNPSNALIPALAASLLCIASCATPIAERAAPSPVAAQPVTLVLTGRLALYGGEAYGWLGLLDSSGTVTRLNVDDRTAIAQYRTLQNKQVIVTALPMAPYLSTPQVNVLRLVLAH